LVSSPTPKPTRLSHLFLHHLIDCKQVKVIATRQHQYSVIMHPPLDRPHPDCQLEIEGLRTCHATESKLKFWACNEVKANLDRCFKLEKEDMLRRMNANLQQSRNEEHAQASLAVGRTQTFQEFLATDETYRKDVENERKRQSSWLLSFLYR
jgi:COX assembly mitochondrial protein 2